MGKRIPWKISKMSSSIPWKKKKNFKKNPKNYAEKNPKKIQKKFEKRFAKILHYLSHNAEKNLSFPHPLLSLKRVLSLNFYIFLFLDDVFHISIGMNIMINISKILMNMKIFHYTIFCNICNSYLYVLELINTWWDPVQHSLASLQCIHAFVECEWGS